MYQVPYSNTHLEFDLPPGMRGTVVVSRPAEPLPDVEGAITEALAHPTGSPPLREMAGRGDRICIVFTDVTRASPDHLLVPALLRELEAAGVHDEDITLLCGIGMHRPSTPEERVAKLGAEVVAHYRVIDNEPQNPRALVNLGATPGGVPVSAHRAAVEADLLIGTGLVEPHQYAGYSGGRKSICPGLCATGTILAFHRPELMESPLGVSGNLVNNPVDEEAHDVARLAGGADFILNVALNERRQITGIFAGDMLPAHNEATDHALRQCGVQIPQPVDIVISTGGGYPLDLTYYQGVKGMVAAEPIVKRGGTIIIAQENAEGIGGPECEKMLLETDDIYVAVQSCLAEDVRIIDMWQLHKLELVLRKARILNYSTGISQAIQSDLFVTPVDSVEAAVAACLTEYGPDATIAVMPEGP